MWGVGQGIGMRKSFFFSVKYVSHTFAPWLVGADCEGPWLLIELRICSDPRAASFICLIIVEQGGDGVEGGRERNGPQIPFKKAGFLNQLFTFGGCHQR